MHQQVVLEVGNRAVKAGTVDASSLPLKTFPSWGRRTNEDDSQASKFIGSTEAWPTGRPESYRRALVSNELCDMDFFLDLLEYAMLVELNIPRESFDQVQLILILPSHMVAVQLPLRAKIIHRVYERLGVNGVFVGEAATMAALGSAHGTALVLDFGADGVEVAAVSDFSLVTTAVEFFPFGGDVLDQVLADALSEFANAMSDDNVVSMPAQFARLVHSDPMAAAVMLKEHFPRTHESDTIAIVTPHDETVKLPLSLFTSAMSRVFVENVSTTLIDVIGSVLGRCEGDRRTIMMNHVIVTGGLSNFPLLRPFLQSALTGSTVLAVSDYPSDSQPTLLAFRAIPDYYHEIRDKGAGTIAWFGASLAGKYAFADAKTFIPSPPKSSSNA